MTDTPTIPVLTAREAALRLGVTSGTIKIWCRTRKLKGARLRMLNGVATWLVPEASVNQEIERTATAWQERTERDIDQERT